MMVLRRARIWAARLGGAVRGGRGAALRGGPAGRQPGVAAAGPADPPAFGEGAGGRGRDARGTEDKGPPRGGMPCTRPPGRKNGSGCAGIPYLALSVAQVETYRGSRPVDLGSGFFYAKKDKTYYITNRHLVTGECRSQRPDAIKLNLHADPVVTSKSF